MIRFLCETCGAHWDSPSADEEAEARAADFQLLSSTTRADGTRFIQGTCEACWLGAYYPKRIFKERWQT